MLYNQQNKGVLETEITSCSSVTNSKKYKIISPDHQKLLTVSLCKSKQPNNKYHLQL